MENKSTRIVLLGKKTKKGETLQDMFTEVLPNSIPKKFCHSVTAVYGDNSEYKIPFNKLSEKLPVKSDEHFFENLDLADKDEIVALEIILDLDNLKEFLDSRSEQIFNTISLKNS